MCDFNNNECSICFVSIGVWDNTVTRCGHKFHLTCLMATHNPYCPYCKTDMRLNPNIPKKDLENIREKVKEQVRKINAPMKIISDVVDEMLEEDPDYQMEMEIEDEKNLKAFEAQLKKEEEDEEQEKALREQNPFFVELRKLKKQDEEIRKAGEKNKNK